jgi:thiol-disulfide isomerase/thioredoxin
MTHTPQALATEIDGASYPISTLRPTRTPLGNYPPPDEGAIQTPEDTGRALETAYPGPNQASATQTEIPGNYPAGVSPSVTQANGAYPAPDAQATASSTPQITAEASQTDSAVTPTLGQISSTTPTPALSTTPTPYLILTPTQSPTVTPTPTPVRTELLASDPEEFRLVSGKLQLLVFFADWSSKSRSMAPVIYFLEGKFGEDVLFTYLDYDDPRNELFAVLLEEQALPAIFLLNGEGEVLAEWDGIVALDTLDAAISSSIVVVGR